MKILDVLKGNYLQQIVSFWLSPKRIPWLIVAGVLIRLLGFLSDGHNHDFEHFEHWASRLAECGFQEIYKVQGSRFFCDYPPLYLYVLWGMGNLFNFLDISIFSSTFDLSLKGFSLVFETVLLGFFWKITRHKTWFFFLVLNPVILLNAYFWGQVDLIFGGILLMAVITLIQNRFVYAALLAGLALSMKSQMLLFVPLFGIIYLLKGNGKMWGQKSLGILAAIAGFIIPSIPYLFHENPMISFEPHYTASGRYPYIAMNAMNIWWALFADFSLKVQLLFPSGETEIFGFISRKNLAFLCFAPIYGAILFWCVKFRKSLSPEFIIKMFAVLSISYFMWLPEMHERYSFPFFIFAPGIIFAFKKEWLFYFAFTGIHVFNLLWAWGEQTHFTQEWFFNYGRMIAAIHFILWCAYFYETYKTLASAKTNTQVNLSLGK